MDKTDVPQLHLFLDRDDGGEERVRIVATRDARAFKHKVAAAGAAADAVSASVGDDGRALLGQLKAALRADPASLELARELGFVGVCVHGDSSERNELLRLLAIATGGSRRLSGFASWPGEGLVWPLDALELDGDSRESVGFGGAFTLPGASRLPDFGDSAGHDLLRGDSKESGRGDSNES